MRTILIAAAIALGAATAAPATAAPAAASETFAGASALDRVEAGYARHTREHRMWEIQRNIERQQRYERRGYYGGRGYGPPRYERRYERGPYYERY